MTVCVQGLFLRELLTSWLCSQPQPPRSMHIIIQRSLGEGPSAGSEARAFSAYTFLSSNHQRAPQTNSTRYNRPGTFEMCRFSLFVFFFFFFKNVQRSGKNIRQMANSKEVNLSHIMPHFLLCRLWSRTVLYYPGLPIWMALILKTLPCQEVLSTCFSFPAFLPANARAARGSVGTWT